MGVVGWWESADMPRAPRKEYAGALYHVRCRGYGRGQIFFDEGDAGRFRTHLTGLIRDAC